MPKFLTEHFNLCAMNDRAVRGRMSCGIQPRARTMMMSSRMSGTLLFFLASAKGPRRRGAMHAMRRNCERLSRNVHLKRLGDCADLVLFEPVDDHNGPRASIR
jgi:hypothetical protein